MYGLSHMMAGTCLCFFFFSPIMLVLMWRQSLMNLVLFTAKKIYLHCVYFCFHTVVRFFTAHKYNRTFESHGLEAIRGDPYIYEGSEPSRWIWLQFPVFLSHFSVTQLGNLLKFAVSAALYPWKIGDGRMFMSGKTDKDVSLEFSDKKELCIWRNI